MCVNDFSSNIWVTAFDEAGLLIFGGRKANELFDLKKTDEASFEKLSKKASTKWLHLELRQKLRFTKAKIKSDTHEYSATIFSLRV